MDDREQAINELRSEVRELRRQLREREDRDRRLLASQPLSRGSLLRSAGAGAAGVLAGSVLGAGGSPALAANGSSLILGQDNQATAYTSLSGSVLTDAGLRVSNYYSGPFDDFSDALQAYTYGAGLSALYGRNDAAGGAGVMGYSGSGIGGSFTGGQAPLRLQPAATTGPPTSTNHRRESSTWTLPAPSGSARRAERGVPWGPSSRWRCQVAEPSPPSPTRCSPAAPPR